MELNQKVAEEIGKISEVAGYLWQREWVTDVEVDKEMIDNSLALKLGLAVLPFNTSSRYPFLNLLLIKDAFQRTRVRCVGRNNGNNILVELGLHPVIQNLCAFDGVIV